MLTIRNLPLCHSARVLRKEGTASADELAAVKNILLDHRITLQGLNMVWQYLAAVDLLHCESDDDEVVASFALQFMVLECTAGWGVSQASIVMTCLGKMWTTTWCPSVVINRARGQQLIEITRQPPSPERPRKGLA